METFEQVAEMGKGRWQRAALLNVTPDELEGIEFKPDTDDLGPYVWAAGKVGERRYVLTCHTDSQEPLTLVWVPEGEADLDEAIDEVMLAFDVPMAWRVTDE